MRNAEETYMTNYTMYGVWNEEESTEYDKDAAAEYQYEV